MLYSSKTHKEAVQRLWKWKEAILWGSFLWTELGKTCSLLFHLLYYKLWHFPFLFLKYSSFMGHLPVWETQSPNISDILTPQNVQGQHQHHFIFHKKKRSMHSSYILQHIFCQHRWNNCLSDISKMQASLLVQSLLGALASQVKGLTIPRPPFWRFHV